MAPAALGPAQDTATTTWKPSSVVAVLAALALFVLPTQTADAASVRALPVLQDAAGDLDVNGLQGDGATIDILVPPDIWTLPSFAVQDEAVKMSLSPSQRLHLSSLPSILPHFNTSCSCEHWGCSCCARVEITPIHRNKTGCASLTYVQDRLAVVLGISVNNHTIVERDLISGSNPPPFCFPIPQLPIVTVCLRFSNISLTNDAKVQVCGALEAGLVFTSPLIRLRFGCLKIGKGGVSWSSTPTSAAFNFPAVNDTQSALHQFAAALNSTDNEQFLLLQSILRQQGYFEQASTVLPSRGQKMVWPTIT